MSGNFRVVERKISWNKDFDSFYFFVLLYESKCFRIYGYIYYVDVEIWGELNESGMIFDFNYLSNFVKFFDYWIFVSENWVKECRDGVVIIEKNDKWFELFESEVVIFNKFNVMVEYIVEWFVERVVEKVGDNVRKIRVRIWEDLRSYVEVIFEC